eukprot:scaffold1141_cov369-Prasinococcus_capsulatus_cf.AAC.7
MNQLDDSGRMGSDALAPPGQVPATARVFPPHPLPVCARSQAVGPAAIARSGTAGAKLPQAFDGLRLAPTTARREALDLSARPTLPRHTWVAAGSAEAPQCGQGARRARAPLQQIGSAPSPAVRSRVCN